MKKGGQKQTSVWDFLPAGSCLCRSRGEKRRARSPQLTSSFGLDGSDLFLIPSPPLSLSLSLILAIDTPPVFTRSLSLSLSFSSPTVPQYFQDLPCESEKLRHRAPYTCIHGNPQKQNGGCLRNCGQVFTCYFQRPLPGDENLVCVMIPPVKQLLLIAGGPQVHRQWTDGARR